MNARYHIIPDNNFPSPKWTLRKTDTSGIKQDVLPFFSNRAELLRLIYKSHKLKTLQEKDIIEIVRSIPEDMPLSYDKKNQFFFVSELDKTYKDDLNDSFIKGHQTILRQKSMTKDKLYYCVPFISKKAGGGFILLVYKLQKILIGPEETNNDMIFWSFLVQYIMKGISNKDKEYFEDFQKQTLLEVQRENLLPDALN